ncbi:MAG: dockerin type I repeat-containing protein, partial [Oscillospiraceae bacterium]|nr:dockerin type I repeat-containing protein [Oscillospiraceae bacterium]
MAQDNRRKDTMVKEKPLKIGSAFIGIMMMLQVVPIKDISTKALQIKESNTDIVVSSEYLAGDVNGDGIFSVTDIVVLQKWLHGKGNLECWQNADLNQDS